MKLLQALNSLEVDYVIIGGYSLAAHGYIRATKDVDIVPNPARANLRRLAAALRELEAEVDLEDMDPEELGIAPDEEGLSQGGNWVLKTRFGRLDVMQDVPGARNYKHLRTNAIPVNGALYAGRDDVISMKSAAGRDEDLRDIAALEAAADADA